MSRRRTKLRIVPDTPPVGRKIAATAAGIIPGLVAGLATVAALRYFLTRNARRNNGNDVGVLTAEVHSNGHSEVKFGSLDSFS